MRIRSDNDKEFENSKFYEFCSSKRIGHEFSTPIIPHYNGVVERKKRTLQESTRVMLHVKNLPYHFWNEALNTTCLVHNRVTTRSGTKETQYELWKGKRHNVKYFHVLGSNFHILGDREHRAYMDPKSDERIFLGFYINIRAYMVYNRRTKTMTKSINIVINDTPEDKQEDEDNVSPQQTDVPTYVPYKGLTLSLKAQILNILKSIWDHQSEFKRIIPLKMS